MQRVLRQRVFSVGEQTFTWQDVVDSAVRRGAWEAISRRTRAGLACERRADGDGDPPDPEELEHAANAFRRERNLLAAEEMEAWLAGWGLEIRQWLDWVRRSLLRERWSGEVPADVEPSGEDEWAEAVCSGELQHLALALAERVAAHARFRGSEPGPHDDDEMEAALQRLRDESVTAQTVEREVAAHVLEWTRVDCRYVIVTDEDVARELVLCVREDGLDPAQVAADAGLQLQQRSWYLSDPEPIGDSLLGARPGEILGPLPIAGGQLLCFVVARIAPDATDPVVAERVRARLERRAAEREVAHRVGWHSHAR